MDEHAERHEWSRHMTEDLAISITTAATAERAFEAISDVSGWWGRITGTTSAVGDEFVYVVPGLHYSGFRVVELERPRRISWLVTGSYLDFVGDKQEWNGTTVEFDIAEEAAGTRVTFLHRGLQPTEECYEACANAWSTYIRSSLKSFIETGQGQPNSFEGDEALEESDHADLRRRIEGPAMISAHANDTSAIKNVLTDQYGAWAAGDAAAFVADYAEDATVIMPGSYRRNRDEIQQSMTESFATFLKDTKVTDEIQTVRFLGDDYAIAVSKAGILFAGETEVPASRFIYATWVLQRRDGNWRVESYHNSPVQQS
jgi:uncharacterized protein (TIGR02246 family)